MKPNQRLSYAIMSILSAHAAAAYGATPAAESPAASTEIADIVVTAQRRSESIQNVPITIQALTADTLGELSVSTFDDFIKYLPNVTQGTYGPGQSLIYMRGLGTGALGVQGEGSVGIFPNVAVYLDEQSAQLPSRNLDIYAIDLERIEVLEGPQGTLFGAGAQAGVVRYITNKPKLNSTEANVDGSYGTTAHGDPNRSISATLNLPLIEDKLAVRAVAYHDSRGGYIDNVPSTFVRSGWDLGIASRQGGSIDASGKVTKAGVAPASSTVINNSAIAGKAINPVTYSGIRLSALWKINDDWDALLVQSHQTMDAEGVFYSMPSTGGGPNSSASAGFNPAAGLTGGTPLPELSVSLFNNSYNKDNFTNTALTVNGKLGALKVVYAGAYLVRNVEQVTDYTNYARGLWGSYYQCTGFSNSFDPPSKCYSPSSVWTDTERLRHQSHEIRLSTPDDKRLRALAGLYYEDLKINDDTEWLYRSVPVCTARDLNSAAAECFLNIQPWPGAVANNSNVRNAQTGFFDDVTRGYKQKAAFASVDFDIIPKALTLTLGTRYFRFDEHVSGGAVGSFYCKFYGGYYIPTSLNTCSTSNNNGSNHNFYVGPAGAPVGKSPGPYGADYGKQVPNSSKESGYRSRANLSWKVTDRSLLYYTFSQGYRPGGFNRGSSGHVPIGYVAGVQGLSTKCGYTGKPLCQWYTPLSWQSDNLSNNEIGWKSDWLNRHLQINGAIYQEKWTNVQTQFFDPQQGFGNLTFNTNGPNYKVKGLELQVIVQPVRGLTVTGSGSWNKSEQTNSPAFLVNNPCIVAGAGANAACGRPAAFTPPATYGQPLPGVPNPYGVLGSRLAMSPAFEGNLRARYDWDWNSYRAFAQFGGNHIGETISQAGNVSPFIMRGYTTYDGSAGAEKGSWSVSLYAQNVSNVLASSYTSSNQFVVTQTVLRPRVFGLKLGYKFSGK